MRSVGLVGDPDRSGPRETRETARQLRSRIHLDCNAFRLGGARQAEARRRQCRLHRRREGPVGKRRRRVYGLPKEHGARSEALFFRSGPSLLD